MVIMQSPNESEFALQLHLWKKKLKIFFLLFITQNALKIRLRDPGQTPKLGHTYKEIGGIFDTYMYKTFIHICRRNHSSQDLE